MYSGTSPYGHLTSKKTSPLQSPWLSPKLYSTVQITPCNKVTSALRSLLPSPVGDLNSEVPLYSLCGNKPYLYVYICDKSGVMFSLLMLQTGPASGVDKVKKGGSYMCIKVNCIIITSFFLLFGFNTGQTAIWKAWLSHVQGEKKRRKSDNCEK